MNKSKCEICENFISLFPNKDVGRKILEFYGNPHKEFYAGIVLYMKHDELKNEISYMDIVCVKNTVVNFDEIHLKFELKCFYGFVLSSDIFNNYSVNYKLSKSNKYLEKIMNIINDNNFKIKFRGFQYKINNKKSEEYIIEEKEILKYNNNKLELIIIE